MRTFLVLICSLALACTADAKEEKRKGNSASKGNHTQSVQHESARGGGSGSGQNLQRGGHHLQQPKAPQRVAKPHVAPAGVRPAVQPQQQGGPETAAHTIQPQPQGGPDTAHRTAAPQSPAAPLTKEQLDEAYAQSQGFRSAEQYRKWKETGRVEAPVGVVTSQTPAAGGGPGSVQKAEHGITASAIRPATNQAKANPFRPQHFNLPSKPTPEMAGVKFQQNRRISESDRWVGSNYQVFRNYRCEWHDRDWWRHHHSRIAFVLGGWYYWNARHWFPAWGYDSAAYYAYDGPIYAYNDLPPDQAIANVQAALQALGYYHGPINGILGPLTRVAIAAYQRDHGLYVTSVIDESTMASLGMV